MNTLADLVAWVWTHPRLDVAFMAFGVGMFFADWMRQEAAVRIARPAARAPHEEADAA